MAVDYTVTGCESIKLPPVGTLTLGNGETLYLDAESLFVPSCQSAESIPNIVTRPNDGFIIYQTSSTATDPKFSDLRDPFYASTFPVCYALAATTVVAYTLFIMLIVAPRSFLDGGVAVLGRRGFTRGPSNGTSIGGRPWLQKIAALAVAISLTIATADTFRVAEEQYALGIQNAEELQVEVLNGTQLEIIRLISDTFLWLAQAQTLIRLFPRQREKIIIKWTAFCLISLDVVFSALDSFVYTRSGMAKQKNFSEAIPALSYLFQLALGVLYAAWVIYYALMKKRYAFYHPQMKNICLMAILSILAILVPVVFFILDICKPAFTGWGDYVRWVGAAAASVIVWEWVERIEALEREEKKDGILGREVFDGDEMTEFGSSEFSWPRRRKSKKKHDDDGGESDPGPDEQAPLPNARGKMWPAMSSIATRYIPKVRSNTQSVSQRAEDSTSTPANSTGGRFLRPPLWPSRPRPAITPVSRTETASADSTEYTVHYQTLTDSNSHATPERDGRPISRSTSSASSQTPFTESEYRPSSPHVHAGTASTNTDSASKAATTQNTWHSFSRLMRSRNSNRDSVAGTSHHTQSSRSDYDTFGRWDIRGRLDYFAAAQAERIRERMRPTPDTDSLPVTVVPAPPRRGAALAQLVEDEEQQAGIPLDAFHNTSHSPMLRRAVSGGHSSAQPTPSMLSRSDSDGSASSRTRPDARPPDRPSSNCNRRDGGQTHQRISWQDAEILPPALSAPRRPVDDILEEETQQHPGRR